MELVNRTGFPAIAFPQYDRMGGLQAVVSARGTFDLVPGGALAVSAEQEPFQWEDFYEGEPQIVPLTRQNDLVPFKPGTDVTVLADAHCPDPAGAPSWKCRLRMLGAGGAALLDKQVRVTGPRWWRPRLRAQWRTLLGVSADPVLQGWTLTEPEPARVVPLDWRFARGGPMPDEVSGSLNRDNPIGRGIVGHAGPAVDRPWPAPQVEEAKTPLTDWQADPAPCCFGPIARFWQVRARHCGSGQLVRLEDGRPVLPADFDERYWQCAPPHQIVTPWLRGTERFELTNLHPSHARLLGTLPGIMLGLTVYRREATAKRVTLNLDGVHFDLRPDWERVVLTWRVRLPVPAMTGVRLTLAERTRLAEAPRVLETEPADVDGFGP